MCEGREDAKIKKKTHFGGGGDGPRAIDKKRCSFSTSDSLVEASAWGRFLSLKLNERVGNFASAEPTLNWIDFRRGLLACGLCWDATLGVWLDPGI